jgi:hypothetical protein
MDIGTGGSKSPHGVDGLDPVRGAEDFSDVEAKAACEITPDLFHDPGGINQCSVHVEQYGSGGDGPVLQAHPSILPQRPVVGDSSRWRGPM